MKVEKKNITSTPTPQEMPKDIRQAGRNKARQKMDLHKAKIVPETVITF